VGTPGPPPQEQVGIAVGDPMRVALRRCVIGVLWCAAAFLVFTVPTKQIPSLYGHAPWLDDPYDTVYSFAMFLVPLIAAFVCIPLALCRSSQRLPSTRVSSLRRGCRLALAVMGATAISCWSSVAAQANRSQWNAATVALVAGLAAVTLLVAKSAVDLRRVAWFAPTDVAGGSAGPDLLDDLVTLVEEQSRLLGPWREVVLRSVSHVERRALSPLRRHPIIGAAVLSVAFGSAVALGQGVAEHYVLSAFVLTGLLLACGMFAFLVAAGNYLGLARAGEPLIGVRRRLIDALVGACVGSVGALAFRDSLWWLVGATPAGARTVQLATLVSLVALGSFVVILTGESIARAHSRSR
jgi:hypothetical protein